MLSSLPIILVGVLFGPAMDYHTPGPYRSRSSRSAS